MSRSNAETCSVCRHVNPGELDPHNIGAPRPLHCRRMPPQVFVVPMPDRIIQASAWPTVQHDQACGEWTARLDS